MKAIIKELRIWFWFFIFASCAINNQVNSDEPCDGKSNGPVELEVITSENSSNAISSDTIGIQWNLTSFLSSGVIPKNVTIFYTLASIGHNWNQNPSLVWEEIVAEFPEKTNHTITDLLPKSGYDVQVQFLLTNGTVVCSEMIHITTADVIPLVEGLKIDQNSLKWNPIENIDIREYCIEKREISLPGSHRNFKREWELAEDCKLYENEMWELSNLVERKRYEFTVYAVGTNEERGDSATPLQYTQPERATYLQLYLGISLPLVFLIALFTLFGYCYHKIKKKRVLKIPGEIKIDNQEGFDWELFKLRGLEGVSTTGTLPEIPRDHFSFSLLLGEGAFGEVYQAKITQGIHRGMSVAVKTLRAGANELEKKEFMDEAFLMSKLTHINIITTIGVCRNPFYLVLELMDGDLKNYLRKSRSYTNPRRAKSGEGAKLSLLDLLNMSLDVASGCQYLAERTLVHRDLAARNCLVSSNENEKLIVKLADFGMARNIYANRLYKKEGEGKFPIKWMAPESITHQEYTIQSDVWSFGVVLWEIMKLGATPYGLKDNEEVIKYVTSGNYLDHPIGTPDNIYQLMVECWSFEPDKRPSFTYICDRLQQLKENCTKLQPNSAFLDLLAPSNERIILAGIDNYAFSDDYGNPLTSDSFSKPPKDDSENRALHYVDVVLNHQNSAQDEGDSSLQNYTSI